MYTKEQLENVDYLKWKVNKADDYRYDEKEKTLYYMDGDLERYTKPFYVQYGVFKGSLYCYNNLLTRAIEGVTRSHAENSTRYWIEMSYDTIEVYDSADNTITANYYFDGFQGEIDLAKDNALYYVYEKEILNENVDD